jgi:glucose/arabinose dehydrogenase
MRMKRVATIDAIEHKLVVMLRTLKATSVLCLVACGGTDSAALAQQNAFDVGIIADFDQPWAMAFLPDGRLLVTEMRGELKILSLSNGALSDVSGVPDVSFGGQGGLGDIVLHPRFATNRLVYFSYVEAGTRRTSGAAVARATLSIADGRAALADVEVIWRQSPKVSGDGHFGHRIAFDDAGMLWISSGERQKFDPAQDMSGNLGKILRLNDDGTVPVDNPFVDRGGIAAQIWSLGHRNPLGIAFDGAGRLWSVEMGPRGGDELNLIERGANYGYPMVSNGDHYSGIPIPDHDTRPEFNAPAVYWNPVISPSSLMFYHGSEISAWQGSAFIGGLSSEALVRVEFDGDRAYEAERFELGARIRQVLQGPDETIWLLEDGRRGGRGRLLRLIAR